MEPIQGTKGLVLPDIAALTSPVLRVFDKVADRKPEITLDRGEHAHHPASAADLHVQPRRHSGSYEWPASASLLC
jgi:hypothetical protein